MKSSGKFPKAPLIAAAVLVALFALPVTRMVRRGAEANRLVFALDRYKAQNGFYPRDLKSFNPSPDYVFDYTPATGGTDFTLRVSGGRLSVSEIYDSKRRRWSGSKEPRAAVR